MQWMNSCVAQLNSDKSVPRISQDRQVMDCCRYRSSTPRQLRGNTETLTSIEALFSMDENHPKGSNSCEPVQTHCEKNQQRPQHENNSQIWKNHRKNADRGLRSRSVEHDKSCVTCVGGFCQGRERQRDGQEHRLRRTRKGFRARISSRNAFRGVPHVLF